MLHKKNRISLLRTQIITLLERVHKPLTVPEIIAHLTREGVLFHKTSLYRQIDMLCAQNVIEAVLLDSSVTYYEITRIHHHHMICVQCYGISCVRDPEIERAIKTLERKIKKSTGFLVDEHHFSCNGVCVNCL